MCVFLPTWRLRPSRAGPNDCPIGLTHGRVCGIPAVVRDVGAKVGLLTTTETAVVAGLAVAQVLVLRRVLASPAVVEALATSV